jgi:NAD(P)H-dependent flavin oxidoreductase YrpB (nitropropane dioxygenase family)
MVALSDYHDLVECAIEEDADILFVGAGLPLRLPKSITPDRLKEIRTRFVPIVSSARAAQMIFQYWHRKYNHVPDGIVVEGPMAGGHLGFKREQIDDPNYALEKLVSELIGVIKPFEQHLGKHIPIIAAGGIYTGSDIHKYLSMGIQGVQMGTRFVTTHECDAHIRLKEAYIKSRPEDLVIIDSPVGLPGRAIRNSFLSDASAGIKKPFKCPWKCLKTCKFQEAPYCIALALTNAQSGNLEHGFSFAGSNTYRTDKIVSVSELMQALVEEYEEASFSTIRETHANILI